MGKSGPPLLTNHVCWEQSSAEGLEGSRGPLRAAQLREQAQPASGTQAARSEGRWVGVTPGLAPVTAGWEPAEAWDWTSALSRDSVVNEPIPTSARRDSY